MKALINKMFVKSNSVSQNMILVEETETGQITLAKISSDILEVQKDKYIIKSKYKL